ncbi:phosphatase PAP2 family protein [Bifidobacterium magnum]|uniref:Phosphatase n=1 Tax=Bifidobacterium magnum TaxID=1692 RepID=A0A087BCT3_9BIFI|nr:phosphatase PAP2 family protein [Bifidobacterium magnum]KFI68833.1 Phosphatase [Bifidobacterium magnum]
MTDETIATNASHESRTNAGRIPQAYWFVLLIIAVGALIVGSFHDLGIDRFLYDPDATWAKFFYAYGPAPLYWSLEVAGLIMLRNITVRRASYNRLLKAFGVLLIAFAVLYSLVYALKKTPWNAAVSIVLAVVLFEGPSLGLYALVRHCGEMSLRILCIFLLASSLLPYVIVFVCKEVVRRPRFIALLGEPQLSFQPWWEITRKNMELSTKVASNPDLFRSFPSGHTVSAAAILGWTVLPEYCKRLEPYRWVFYIVCPLYVGVVAFSRLVLGYHFLTDVSFAFLVATACCAVAYVRLYRLPANVLDAQHVARKTVLIK